MSDAQTTATTAPAAARDGAADEVLLEVRDGLGRITLNRPRALNALTQDMVRAIDAALTDWAADPAVRGVLIRGAGEKGLCAGGDVVSLRSSLLAGRFAEAEEFFRDEYAMNERIAAYPKPYVAFMDGIVLGGGMGVSAHGSHRVATERTRAGMPETAIGFTPDVGGSFHLARAPFQAGRHLAATSAHASGSDAVALGLADVFVESARLDELEQALAAAFGALGSAADAGARDEAAFAAADEVLARFAVAEDARPASALVAGREWIEDAYGRETAAEVLAALDERAAAGGEHAEAAGQAAEAIRTKSPTAVAVAHEAQRRLAARGADLTVADALRQEFTIGTHLMREPDMAEGIRALLVDKDKDPTWSPARLEDVSAEDVAGHFEPVPGVDPLQLG